MMNGDARVVVVTLMEDLPDRRLERGQMGTVVGSLGPDMLEVNFVDDDGQSSETVPVDTRHLLIGHY